MVRKQLYLTEAQQRKLHRLAQSWGSTESEVIRTALDRLPDPEASIIECLQAAGLLVPPPDDEDLPSKDEMADIERTYNEWAMAQGPLGLSDAVIEDRR